MSAWVFLAIAIFLEVAATLMLKVSNGFEKWYWAAGAIGCYTACFWFFAPALKHIPVGVAYAIWAGVGIVAIALIGAVGFKEQLSPAQLGCIGMVVFGAVGLRLTTAV